MTVSPGLTPAKARVSAGLRSASRCLSSSGRAPSATAAAMYAGIDGAAEASDAPRSEISSAPVVASLERFMEFLLLAPFHLTIAQDSIRRSGPDGLASPRQRIAAALGCALSPPPVAAHTRPARRGK